MRVPESKIHKVINFTNRSSAVSGTLGYGTTATAETMGLTGASLSMTSVADAATNIAGFLGGEAIDRLMLPGSFEVHESIKIFDNPPNDLGEQVRRDLETLKQYNDLALKALRDPSKVKDFHLGNETFGKKGARNKLKEGLEFAKLLKNDPNLSQYENDLNKIMENIANAKKSVQVRLHKARTSKAIDLASKGASFAIGAISAAGDFGTSAAIGLGASAVVKVGDVMASRLEKTRGRVTVQQDEKFLDSDMGKLEERGLANVDPDNLDALRHANEVALDVLKNPNKRKGFGPDQFGKKEAKRKLKEVLIDFDNLIQGFDEQVAGEGMTKVRADLENALRIVSRNLRKARGKKAAKVAAATAACVAATVAIVTTAGTATPLVATALALSALSATTKAVGTAIDLAKK
jgi:hypothetical protein